MSVFLALNILFRLCIIRIERKQNTSDTEKKVLRGNVNSI